MTTYESKRTSGLLLAGAMVLGTGLVACGSDETDENVDKTGQKLDCSAVDVGNYQPFDPANLQNQLARVDAYEAIKSTRKGDGFAATDFGDLLIMDPALSTPSETTIASLFVETAGLAEKVEGRGDDHSYALSGEPGVRMNEMVRASIAEGGDAAAMDRDDVLSIDWHGQQVDKTLQRFFYLSVHHELVLGARKNWDEAVGYYGRSLDGEDSRGIAGTVASRDENCSLGLNDEIFAKLSEGQCVLDAALDEAGVDELDPSTIPELQAIIDDIDLNMLTAFAISASREFRDLPSSEKPAIKLIEGRLFFDILEPFMMDRDAAAAKFIRAEVDKMDPADVDAEGIVTAITEVFKIEQTFADCN